MSCFLALGAMCLLDTSGVYVTGEVYNFHQYKNMDEHYEVMWCKDHYCRGPMGVLKVGVQMDLTPHMVLDYGFRHSSFILDPDDRGQTGPFLSLTLEAFPMKDAVAALVVLEVKRLHGDTITLEQLHDAIVEALELNEMELPYEIGRHAPHDRGVLRTAEIPGRYTGDDQAPN